MVSRYLTKMAVNEWRPCANRCLGLVRILLKGVHQVRSRGQRRAFDLQNGLGQQVAKWSCYKLRRQFRADRAAGEALLMSRHELWLNMFLISSCAC